MICWSRGKSVPAPGLVLSVQRFKRSPAAGLSPKGVLESLRRPTNILESEMEGSLWERLPRKVLWWVVPRGEKQQMVVGVVDGMF